MNTMKIFLTKGTKYFSARLQMDLFGACIVMMATGDKTTGRAKIRSEVFACPEDGQTYLEILRYSKERNGYRIADFC